MRNIRLDLEYDGRNYYGWQWQPDRPTIEKTVKDAIEKIIRHTIILYSSGRTDTGVHAEQHVAHFFSETRLEPLSLLRGINAVLPPDIVVYSVVDMPLEWRARRDALDREYRYTFFRQPAPSALFRDYTYWVRDELDVEAMRAAARFIVGKHDFSAFRSLQSDAEHARREIYELILQERPPFLHLRIRGTAFLRHQVRTIGGTLLEVGQGKLDADQIPEILQSKDRRRAGPTLPARGLTLVAVRYAGDAERGVEAARASRFHFPGWNP
ncbi:MAG: tRNA pseudouridine(38-40) synthase TruA [bacterium]